MAYPKLTDCVSPTRVSRPAANPISLAARRFARQKPQQPQPTHSLSGADQLALARIAERFAPGAHPAPEPPEVPKDRPFESETAQAPIAIASLAMLVPMRMLIMILIVVALLPSLAFGALLWTGVLQAPWSPPAGSENNALPPAKSALAATTPVPDPAQKQAAAIGALALTAPDSLDAKAGQDTPFAIALDHTGDLPARSVIAISGLPQGAMLSSGRPYGETEWSLRLDEIGDLQLALPKAASGETTLRVKLVAPDGEIVASTETALKIAADPNAPAVASGGDSEPQFEFDSERTLAPQVIYDQDLIGIGAWDEQSRQRLVSTGVEERLTAPDTPAPPPGEVLRLPDTESAKASDHPLRAKWIKPSAYVNLRDGPTASASVISIVPKGTKLSVLGRKRGWVKVTNPATSETGWVYSGNIVGSSKSKRGGKRQSQQAVEDPGSSLIGSLFGR
jgi:Bacterial SH3 domain